jgi:hypothetical protein
MADDRRTGERGRRGSVHLDHAPGRPLHHFRLERARLAGASGSRRGGLLFDRSIPGDPSQFPGSANSHVSLRRSRAGRPGGARERRREAHDVSAVATDLRDQRPGARDVVPRRPRSHRANGTSGGDRHRERRRRVRRCRPDRDVDVAERSRADRPFVRLRHAREVAAGHRPGRRRSRSELRRSQPAAAASQWGRADHLSRLRSGRPGDPEGRDGVAERGFGLHLRLRRRRRGARKFLSRAQPACGGDRTVGPASRLLRRPRSRVGVRALARRCRFDERGGRSTEAVHGIRAASVGDLRRRAGGRVPLRRRRPDCRRLGRRG